MRFTISLKQKFSFFVHCYFIFALIILAIFSFGIEFDLRHDIPKCFHNNQKIQFIFLLFTSTTYSFIIIFFSTFTELQFHIHMDCKYEKIFRYTCADG